MNKNIPADELRRVLTRTDHLTVSPAGDLMIEGCSAENLLEEFGSPLYVVSESTLRENFRRIRAAFSDRWPARVNVLYAIKANNNLAVRAILDQEGAGGDCFGEGEFHATFAGSADPSKVVINGSYKSPSLLRKAVEMEVTVNIDSMDEIDAIERLAEESDMTARVALRLKALGGDYDAVTTDYFGGSEFSDYVRRSKWGFSPDAAEQAIRRIEEASRLDLLGYHFHIGRASRDIHFFELWARALGGIVSDLQRRTGFSPRVLNVGGGWPRERDPESRSLELNPTSIERYAATVCSTLLEALDSARLTVPELWLEPGRFIAGNAVVFLARVGTIKRDLGLSWVNLDASTNNLMRIDTSHSAHHIFPATGMLRKGSEKVILVGETCVDSVLSSDLLMPALSRGEPIAILDAGMYAETASTQFNGIPRPATVLVNGQDAEVIKARETIEDVFAKHLVPARLRRA